MPVSVFPFPGGAFAPDAWELVKRVERPRLASPVPPHNPMPLSGFGGDLRSSIFMAGVSSPDARPTWTTGGWLQVGFDAISVVSDPQIPIVQLERYRVPLGVLQVFQLPPGSPPETYFNFQFPRWIPSASVEVWQFINS